MRRGPITPLERRHLVIMIKEPRPGRVKTRLAADIGVIDATWWFRHQVAALLRKTAIDPRWTTWLAVSPDTAMTSGYWPAGLPRMPQGSGDLGARMRRVFGRFCTGSVLIIGADIPGIDKRHIAAAFDTLDGNDVVFGPAPDGGYWLVGVKSGKALPESFLMGVRWSSSHALEDSLKSLGGRRRVGVTNELADVDSVADLRRLNSRGQSVPR